MPWCPATSATSVRSLGSARYNLHVFNASQICFNYLLGTVTTAVPAVPGTDQVSWGVNAWARPGHLSVLPDRNKNDEGFAGTFQMARPNSIHVRNNPFGRGPESGW